MENKSITIKDNHESLQGFNERQKSMILARNEKRIKEVEQDDIEDRIVNIIQTTFFEYGRRKPIDEHEIEAQKQDDLVLSFTLIKDLQRDFKFLTIKDVENAFSMGVRGEFGKIIGVNVRTFYQWLKEYDERRRTALKMHKVKLNQTINLQEAKQTVRHEMSIEDLQVHFDNVQEYLIEHERLPVVSDWLCVFWYLQKTGKSKELLDDEKTKAAFEIYFEQYIARTAGKDKGIKAVKKLIESFDHTDPTTINAKRQQFAKFYFIHNFKLKQ